jgi:hypothetical protein
MHRRRLPPWRTALALLVSVAFLCLLFVAAKDEENLRLAPSWRPEIEPLLLIAALAGLALMGRPLSGAWRWLLALLIFMAALLQFADAVVLQLMDRELNLYFDLPQLPGLIGLFCEAEGRWRGGALIAGLAFGGLLVVAATAGALFLAERAFASRRYYAVLCLAVAGVALALAPIRVGDQSLLAARTTQLLVDQGVRLYRSWVVMSGSDPRYSRALDQPQPAPGPLPGLKHHDVYIVFFESYGSVALDDPRFAPTVRTALADFAQRVKEAGYHLRSSRVLSPTFGGGSWLAHGTLDAGLKLDPFLTRFIANSRRETLPGYMAAAGYRTLVVAPGLTTPAPEHGLRGFERSYLSADLAYQGPPFGWFGIPDQYTLRRFDEIEGTSGQAPLFAQIVLVSSHTPFAPVPPFLEDWNDAGLYRSVAPAQWNRIYAPPDWSHLETPYAQSIVYCLKTLGSWLARRPGDALVVILGDHQPPGFISGDKQPWTVPIHVLSRDAEVLRPFAAWGYVEGAMPPQHQSFKGMESFLGDFLAAYSRETAVADEPAAAEHRAD